MRKTTLIIAVFVLGICMQAQEDTRDINTGFADQINHVFEYLEKDRVPHGLLKDYAFEFTELTT